MSFGIVCPQAPTLNLGGPAFVVSKIVGLFRLLPLLKGFEDPDALTDDHGKKLRI
ncbi:hypothetical protein VCSRO93_3706 [Vibrio cholerae]|nr:hypothetical protein VCSRO93_3706 [Vibrio cholerae]